MLVQDSADYRGHQASLRSGSLIAANALRPLVFDLFAAAVVKIFAVGDFVRAEGIDQCVGLALDIRMIRVRLLRLRQRLQGDGNLRGNILFQTFVHQVERCANRDGGNGDANQQAHLLPEGSRADQVSSL